MSENQEFEMNQGLDPMAAFPDQGQAAVAEPTTRNLNEISDSVDGQTYFLGEVPQAQLVDPSAFLPLNSDRLIGSSNMIDKLLFDVGAIIEEEVASIQKHQKRIAFWEDKIEKNKAQIQKNEAQIKQNNIDAQYDKKNRNYWIGRAEEVEIDFSHAEASGRHQTWAWLVKKYGLKNADGSEIDSKMHCVEELCNGEINNLAAEYRTTANKYETARKEREVENSRLVRDNSKLMNTNDTLQTYISNTYTNHIEILQDGILLMKELGVKLKTLGQDEKSSYADLRSWAEPFVNDFIKVNYRVPQAIVVHFRKLTSIPLPPEYC